MVGFTDVMGHPSDKDSQAQPPLEAKVYEGLDNIDEIRKIRRKYFSASEGYSDEDIESTFDDRSIHVVACKNEIPVGVISLVLGSDLPFRTYSSLLFSEEHKANDCELRLMCIYSDGGGPDDAKSIMRFLMFKAHEVILGKRVDRVYLSVSENVRKNAILFTQIGFEELATFLHPRLGVFTLLFYDLRQNLAPLVQEQDSVILKIAQNYAAAKKGSSEYRKLTKGKKVYVYRRLVYLKEVNIYGEVYFTHYFDWQGEAREKFAMDCLNLNFQETPVKFVTKSASVDFLNPYHVFDEVVISVKFENIKQFGLGMVFTYLNEKTGKAHAVGKEKIAFINASGEIIPIPEAMKIVALLYS